MDYAVSPDVLEQVPESLWRRLLAEPERAPEEIALAGVEHFAPQAERWAASRAAQPPAERARAAVRRHVRMSGFEGAAGGLGGAFTALADLAALAWIQSRMVFFVAAAQGFDPWDPIRPAELLVLQRLYPTVEDAQSGLDGSGARLATQVLRPRSNDGRLGAQLAKTVGQKAARRGMLKAVPVLSSPICALENARATAELGERALDYYVGTPASEAAGLFSAQARP